LRYGAGALPVVFYQLSVFRVNMVNAAGELIDKPLHINPEIDKVRGVVVKTPLFSSAHQLNALERGIDIIDKFTGMGLVGELDAVLAELVQHLSPPVDKFLLHVGPALRIGPGEEPAEVFAADKPADHGDLQGVCRFGALHHPLHAEFVFLLFRAGTDRVGVLAVGSQNKLPLRSREGVLHTPALKIPD